MSQTFQKWYISEQVRGLFQCRIDRVVKPTTEFSYTFFQEKEKKSVQNGSGVYLDNRLKTLYRSKSYKVFSDEIIYVELYNFVIMVRCFS